MYTDVNKKLKGVHEPPAVPLWTKMENKKVSARTTDKEKKETARFNIHEYFAGLSDSEQKAIDLCQEMLEEKLLDVKIKGNFSAQEMCDMFSPYMNNPLLLSRIGRKGMDDKRHINLKTVIAMRRIFGISIDEILDECFQPLEPRKPPQKS